MHSLLWRTTRVHAQNTNWQCYCIIYMCMTGYANGPWQAVSQPCLWPISEFQCPIRPDVAHQLPSPFPTQVLMNDHHNCAEQTRNKLWNERNWTKTHIKLRPGCIESILHEKSLQAQQCNLRKTDTNNLVGNCCWYNKIITKFKIRRLRKSRAGSYLCVDHQHCYSLLQFHHLCRTTSRPFWQWNSKDVDQMHH